MTELGAVGWATVNAILPCPEIEPGEGTVVTGTFKHQANERTRVLRLALEGQPETTGVTDNHPYWSVDRQEFVPAGELHVGETVDTVFGERRVKSLTPIAPDDPSFDGYLYNLETTEHVYRVGTLATLVHNTYAPRVAPSKNVGKSIQDHHGIPWNNKAWNHQRHPLVKLAGNPNLKTLPQNIKALQGHFGRHSISYHQEVRRRLDEAFKKVAGKNMDSAQNELTKVIKNIWKDIKSGKLKPYDHKDVIVIP